MNSRELAEAFVRRFANADIDGIAGLLSEDFRLSGPWFSCSSAAEYLAALQGDLVVDPDLEIPASLQEGSQASVFYIYNGKRIGQWFRCRDGRICETLLVFDPQPPV